MSISNKTILIIAILINCLFGILPAPLFDEDEGFTANVAREMLQNNEYILLTSNFEPRYDKPPLAFWLMAGSIKVFGLQEWAVRLPSILFSAGLLLLLYRFVRKEYNEDKAVLSVLLLVGALQFSLMSKAAIADPMLYFFVVGAFINFWNYQKYDKSKNLYLFTICNALGFLTKGPVILLLSAVWIVALAFKRKKIIWSWIHPIQILLFLAIAAPWFILSYQKIGIQALNEFFLDHNVGRFSQSMEGHSGQLYYYVVVLFFGSLPFALQHFKTIYLEIRRKKDILDFVLWVWFLFVLIFFTLSATKLPHYIMLGFFPLCILSAQLLEKNGIKWAQIITSSFVLILLIAPKLALGLTDKIDDNYAVPLIQSFSSVFDTYYYVIQAACLLTLLVLIVRKNRSFLFICCFLISVNTTFLYYARAQQGPVQELAKVVDLPIKYTNHYTPSYSFYKNASYPISEPKPGDHFVGKITDFRNHNVEVLYSNGGMVWVKIKEETPKP